MILLCPPNNVSLRITHPGLSAAEISNTLDLIPAFSWTAGDLWLVSTSGSIQPQSRIRKETYWCGSLPENSLRVREVLWQWVTHLRLHSVWVRGLIDSGAKIRLDLYLYGSQLAGEEIEVELLKAIVELDIDLGIEVCPDKPAKVDD